MKRFLILICLLFACNLLFLSCASVSVSRDKLRDGNYIDNSLTHSIAVVRTYPLQEFGITPEEWKTHFDNSLLYRASGSGNGFMSKSEVKLEPGDRADIPFEKGSAPVSDSEGKEK